MSTFETVLVVFAAILALAAMAVVYRMIVGPTILDRALASDSLVTLVVMGMAIYAAQAQAAWAGPAMLGLTGLAFIGTVTFARFVAREDPRQGTLHPHEDEPETDTAPHDAIHFDQVAAGLGVGADGLSHLEEPAEAPEAADSAVAAEPSADWVAGDGSFGASAGADRGFENARFEGGSFGDGGGDGDGDSGGSAASRWPDESTEETR